MPGGAEPGGAEPAGAARHFSHAHHAPPGGSSRRPGPGGPASATERRPGPPARPALGPGHAAALVVLLPELQAAVAARPRLRFLVLKDSKGELPISIFHLHRQSTLGRRPTLKPGPGNTLPPGEPRGLTLDVLCRRPWGPLPRRVRAPGSLPLTVGSVPAHPPCP